MIFLTKKQKLSVGTQGVHECKVCLKIPLGQLEFLIFLDLTILDLLQEEGQEAFDWEALQRSGTFLWPVTGDVVWFRLNSLIDKNSAFVLFL